MNVLNLNVLGKQKAKGQSSFLMLSPSPGDHEKQILEIAHTNIVFRSGAEAWHIAQKKVVK